MDTILEMKGITLVYPNGVLANYGVDFSVRAGEIHALVGENGAGKTTLMKILFGLERPDDGAIFLKGQPIECTSPHVAISHGIGMVHQHFMLVPSLTVAENVVLGAEPRRGLFFDWKRAASITNEIAQRYNLPVDPAARVQDIPVGMRQKVEILKALLRGAEILVLDEPTAVLTPQETAELFASLQKLKEQNHTIIFISHKLREVRAISDRVTVMRAGRVVGTLETDSVTETEISRLMVGRDVLLKVNKPPIAPGRPVLRVEGLCYTSDTGKEVLKGIDLELREGEILGVAGVEGNGQRELVEILTGLRGATHGSIWVGDEEMSHPTPRRVRDCRTAHIPEDRMTYGVADRASVEENLISDRFGQPRFNRGPLMDIAKVRETGASLVREFQIRTQSPQAPVMMLSGGNIQKVVVAREFSSQPKLIIANQPTRGIDVGATEFIHRRMIQSCQDGAAILLVSADLNEVMSLSDRLVVMYDGELVAHFPDAHVASEEELGLYMLGVKRQEAGEVATS
ncbi:MAG: ABC transporter ATP-binding protein [Bacillota bacterium]